jgi:anti-sigma B factor antagonist
VSPVPFEASAIEVDGVRVIAIRGELDLSTAPALEPVLEEALSGSEPVVVDLTECEFIDSTGIALVVRAWQRIEGDGGEGRRRLIVCSSNQQVGRVLEISGLGQTIPIHASREEGLAALREEASHPA